MSVCYLPVYIIILSEPLTAQNPRNKVKQKVLMLKLKTLLDN